MQAITRKPADLCVLESIVKELELSETQRADLLASLRRFNLSDDNDPVLKITLATGVMARYMAQLPSELRAKSDALRQSLDIDIKRLKVLEDDLETLRCGFSYDLQTTFEGKMQEFVTRTRGFLSAHMNTLESHKENYALQQQVVKNVESALEHAKKLNKYNSEEVSFRNWICTGAIVSMFCGIVAMIFSGLIWLNLSAMRADTERTLRMTNELNCMQANSRGSPSLEINRVLPCFAASQ